METKLYLGDCLEVMKTLQTESVDAVITDPPYGIAYSTGWLPETVPGDYYSLSANGSIASDVNTAARDFIWAWATENSKPIAMFGTWKVARPANVRGLLIWDKGPAFGMGDLTFPWKPSFEEIYIAGQGWSGKRDEGVLRAASVPRIAMGRLHPMEKPVALLKMLIDKLPAGYTILDPFMGSGSAGVACVQTGRNFIGIEIDPNYFEIAKRRIETAKMQLPLGFGTDVPNMF